MKRRLEPHEARRELRRFAPFDALGDEALDALSRIARCNGYPRGNILHYRGDTDNAVYMVLRGQVKIDLARRGREVTIDILRPGDLLGLVAASTGGAHPAHAVVAEDSLLAKFDRDAFLAWVDEHGLWREVFAVQLAGRVRQAYARIGEHALLSVRDRLLQALLEIAEHEGEESSDGSDVLIRRPTHQELAERIGTSREVVTRVLNRLLEQELSNGDDDRVIRVPMSALVLRE